MRTKTHKVDKNKFKTDTVKHFSLSAETHLCAVRPRREQNREELNSRFLEK
jgi:hypothetical protein